MKIYFDYNQILPKGSVITLGNFDGFHRGHQRILRETIAKAKMMGLPALVMTFNPHPRQFFGFDMPIITPIAQKLSLLKEAGANIVLIQPFSNAFAAISPSRFIEEILIAALGCQHVVVGYDYSFGKDGAGDTLLLRELSGMHGIGCDIIQPVQYEGEIISSSGIREYLAQGNVEKAAQYMGRPFAIRGRVSSGAGRGKSLGFPTANLYPASAAALPAFGVYLVCAATGGRKYWGVANIGCHPTFPGGDISLEVFLLEFSGNLYDSLLEVTFFKQIRPERKFPDSASLSMQLRQDVNFAKTLLARDNMLKLHRI